MELEVPGRCGHVKNRFARHDGFRVGQVKPVGFVKALHNIVRIQKF
jgi:hypothetical protein